MNSTDITPVQQMASSCTGALLVSLFMTPLDVVKIRLQAQERFYAKKCFLYSNGIMDHLCTRTNGEPVVAPHTPEEICNCKWYNRPKYFEGTVDAFVKISRTEGFTSLWSGLSPTLVLAVPATVIYFTTYETLKQKFTKMYPDPSNLQKVSLVSGGLARIWAVSVVSPLELVRTKMQSQKMQFFEVRHALKDLVRTEGITGLWKGYTATILRDVPFSAMYWPTYETIKRQMLRHSTDPTTPTMSQSFIAGAISGSIASTVTLPMDVIKTHRQIELGEKHILHVKDGCVGSNWCVAKEIVRSQGVKGLFTGLTPRILKVAPACAIMISSYEYCKAFFKRYNEEHGV